MTRRCRFPPKRARRSWTKSAGTISRCARRLGSLLIAHDASSGYFERLSEQIVNPALLSISCDVGDELSVGQAFAQYRILEKLATEVWGSFSRLSISASSGSLP